MSTKNVLPGIAANLTEMIAIRHHLHAHPEIGMQEFATAELVANYLQAWGYETHRGIGGTGVVGTLRQGRGGGMIGIRADMDALPIQEQTGLDYASQHSGVMHACGHDGHTAILLAASRHLAESRNFDGTLVVIFQPAEEVDGGAQRMLDDGLFERFPCDAIFGLHNMPGLATGKLGFLPGPFMASTDTLRIVITGVGGHGGMPHEAIDPIVVGSSIVVGLQSIVSRNTNPFETAVITVGSFHAGDAPNVIPAKTELQLCVRALRPEIRQSLLQRIEVLAQAQGAAFGAQVSVELVAGESLPPVINHAGFTRFAKQVALDWAGTDGVIEQMVPVAASEDFAVMLEQRPGCYFFIGNGDGEGGCMVHNPKYDFNDQCLGVAASYWVKLVETFLCADTIQRLDEIRNG
ncbi:M20 aminoacylase family protein [Pseudomonas sp. 3A(2025)]